MGRRRREPAALILAAIVAGIASPTASADPKRDFEHMRTGFPLTGAHERVPCESCHVGGLFEGTPRACRVCHTLGGRWEASAKPPNHVPSSEQCGDCHLTVTWASARFDHAGIASGCSGCHNGAMAIGKPANHVPSSNDCQTCHRTLAWTPARFDHSQVGGACSTCHNGVFATGKHAAHLPTSADCGTCHGTRTWSATLAGFDHAGITTGCFTCHNGTTAAGKGPTHIPSSTTCESCHDTRSWTVTRFDHSGVTGACASCHDGATATGKGPSHFVTTLECNDCHLTTSWTPVRFTHRSPNYPGDHAGSLACGECHLANAQTVQWPFGGYQPDCAGCHASDFRPGPHKKHENPDVSYTVGDLRDCTGSCHVYTDASLTTIKDSRSNEHRVTRREW